MIVLRLVYFYRLLRLFAAELPPLGFKMMVTLGKIHISTQNLRRRTPIGRWDDLVEDGLCAVDVYLPIIAFAGFDVFLTEIIAKHFSMVPSDLEDQLKKRSLNLCDVTAIAEIKSEA